MAKGLKTGGRSKGTPNKFSVTFKDLILAEIERQDARLGELDVEGILRFAEHVLGNAARLWFEATPEQKQRLQRVLFPEGLRYRDGGFGTVVTTLERNAEAGSGLASPRGTALALMLKSPLHGKWRHKPSYQPGAPLDGRH